MKKYLFFCTFFLLFIVHQTNAQETSLVKKIEGKKKLKDIMLIVEKHFKEEKEQINGKNEEEKEEFENELLFWKRWEYYNQGRLKSNGELEDVSAKTIAAWEAVKQKYEGENNRLLNGTNASWNFVGPWSNNYQAGFFRGLARVDKIAFHPTDPDILYAAAPNGGLWYSINNGNSWDNPTFNFPISSVSSVAVSKQNPNKIYVLTGDGRAGGGIVSSSCGIWVTTDGGGNWTKTNFSTTAGNGLKIMVNPTNDNIVYAATTTGLFRSINGGNYWVAPITGGAVYDIEFDPSDANRVYVSSVSRVFVSTNGGVTFPTNTIFTGANRIELAVTPANANYVYALCGPYTGVVNGNTFNGIYRSTDKGLTFSLRANSPNALCEASDGIFRNGDKDQSGYDLAIAANPLNAEDIFIAGKIVWRSTNGGTTLTNITPYNEGNQNATPPANYIHPDVHDLAFHPITNALYATTDGGVYYTNNNGTNWTSISNIHATTFYHMAAAAYDGNKIAAGAQDNGIKYKRDLGDFTHITGADGFDCSFGNNIAVGFYTSVNAGLRRFDAVNGTQASINTPANTAFFPAILADPVNANTVYMASNGNSGFPNFINVGVQKSTNNGINWTRVLNQPIQTALAMSPSNGNRIYALGGNALYRSDNAGTNWTGNITSNTGFTPNSGYTDVAVCPTNSDFVYVTIGGYTFGSKVFYSNDAGATWLNVSGTLPAEINVRCVVVDNNNNAYIGTDMGVFYQAVSSNDWTPYYNTLPRVPITDLAIHVGNSKLRAGTYGHGVWEIDLFTTCDADYNLTGNVYGQQFFQVSNQITSNANITGANVTDVITRAGNSIVLTDGFTVTENNKFKAYIGACETGPVPTNARSFTKQITPNFVNQMDRGDTTALYIYGMIKVLANKNSNNNFSIEAYKTGIYKVIVLDSNSLTELNNFSEYLRAGDSKINSLANLDLTKGKYYIQLYFENELVHFQELFVK